MDYDKAIQILAGLKSSADGDEAAALQLAIEAMEQLDEMREREIDDAVENVGYLLGGIKENESKLTWEYLRKMLNIPDDILDEVERRLGLAGDGKDDK